MGERWPFALFVVVSLKSEIIDDVLSATLPGYAPAFWVATEQYDALKKRYSHNDGTRPPISRTFKSPWTAKPISELLDWLKAKPEDTDLNDRQFAVLDTGARDKPPTVVVCRVEPSGGDEEDDQLILMRKGVVDAVDQLIGAPKDSWTEYARYGGKAEIRYDDKQNEN